MLFIKGLTTCINKGTVCTLLKCCCYLNRRVLFDSANGEGRKRSLSVCSNDSLSLVPPRRVSWRQKIFLRVASPMNKPTATMQNMGGYSAHFHEAINGNMQFYCCFYILLILSTIDTEGKMGTHTQTNRCDLTSSHLYYL